MGWGRGIETEIIPNRGGDYTELGSKWKAGKGFLKPNFELGPNWVNRPPCQASPEPHTREGTI